MYNAPRAATIKCCEGGEALLWAVERLLTERSVRHGVPIGLTIAAMVWSNSPLVTAYLLGGVVLGVCAALLAGGDNARNGQARAREYARAAAADAAAAAEAAALALEGLTGVHSSTAAQPVACKPAPAGSGSDAKVSAACRYAMRPRSRGRLQPGPPTDGSSRARAYLASVLRAAAAICPVRPERSGTGRPRAIRSSRPFSSASPSTARSWRPSQTRPSSRRMGSTACSKRLSPT